MEKINLEEVAFKIISFSGEARSCAMDALRVMREERDKKKALELLKQSEKMMISAEQQHMALIVDEANGIMHTPTILFLHAEDQLLSTQTLMQLAGEMVKMYEMIEVLKEGK